MDSFKIDLKTVISVGSIIAVLGGFYFTTEMRLSSLEEKEQHFSEELDILRDNYEMSLKQIKRLTKRLNQLEK